MSMEIGKFKKKPKIGLSDCNNILKIVTTQKTNSKRTPEILKIAHYIKQKNRHVNKNIPHPFKHYNQKTFI